MDHARQAIRLVLDFDGTLTKEDSLLLVGNAGYNRQNSSISKPCPTPWKTIVEAYMSDFLAHQRIYQPSRESRFSLTEEIKWLNSLDRVERTSAQRVYDAGIFDDVTKDDVTAVVQQAISEAILQLRPGWLDLIRAANAYNDGLVPASERSDMIQIISVNWSRWFIWCTLTTATTNPTADVMTVLQKIAIYANEIPSIVEYDRKESTVGLTPRGAARELRTSGDKVRQLLETTKDSSNDLERPFSIYVGDSATDLECLLAVDMGICIRDEPMRSGQKELSETCKRIGVRVEHISAWQRTTPATYDQSSHGDGKLLWWATDFTDVNAWLTRLSDSNVVERS